MGTKTPQNIKDVTDKIDLRDGFVIVPNHCEVCGQGIILMEGAGYKATCHCGIKWSLQINIIGETRAENDRA